LDDSGSDPVAPSSEGCTARPSKATWSAVVLWLRERNQRWSIIAVGGLIALIAMCALLWRFETFRPWLVAALGGLGAFLSPLPGLMTPTTQGRWAIALLIAGVVALGGWYATNSLNEELAASQRTVVQLQVDTHNLDIGNSVLSARIKSLLSGRTPQDIDNLAVHLQGYYKNKFIQRDFLDIIYVSDTFLLQRPDDGGSLYYEGESYRVLANQASNAKLADLYRSEMVGRFQNYIASADQFPESSSGVAAECYKRPSGYCQERLAWVHHELANYFYGQASQKQGPARADELYESFSHLRDEIGVRKQGFDSNGGMIATCTLLRDIRGALKSLGQDTRAVSDEMGKLSRPCAV
jgi:hypothetical protein